MKGIGNTASRGQPSMGRLTAWLMGLALAAGLAVPACTTTSTGSAPAGCSLTSDCAAGLICALGKCRVHCVTASDCPVAGSSCIDDGRNPVCQTPTEKNTPCTKESDCPVPLACASDYRCRNLCASAADCNVLGITGRLCAKDMNGVDFCADPSEVTSGVITASPPPSAPTATSVVEPDGGASALMTPPGALITTSIGQAGGTLGAMGVTVTIPAGALSSELPITIELSAQPGPTGTISRVFDIGPTGTIFAKPITIAFDYALSQLAGLPPSDFAVETSTAGSSASWTPLSQIVVDVTAHTIAGQTTHMSLYALVEQPVGFADATVPTTPMDAGDATMQASSAPDGMANSGSDGSTCTNVCTAGLTQCGAGGVQTCETEADGCTQWVTTATCGVHQTCLVTSPNGLPTAACTCTASACAGTGTLCQDAATVATCATDANGCLYVASTSICITPTVCAGMASTAACASTCTDSCTQGQTSCVAGGLQTCTLGKNGCWAYGPPAVCGAHQTCTGAAGSAACTCNTDPACSGAGGTCVSSTTLSTCSTDAQNCLYQSATSTCVNGACAGGACCANGCTQGQTSCVLGQLATCTLGANGCWAYGLPGGCGAHGSCTGAPGTGACTCNTSPFCSTAGTACADATTLVTCSVDAQHCVYEAATSTCPAPGFCSGMAPNASCMAVCTDSCEQGQTTCVEGQLATCTFANGCWAFGLPTPCGTNETCTAVTGAAACTCAAPFSSCGDAGTCNTDTSSDSNNCGGCGTVCGGVSPACCNGQCVDTNSNPNDCGTCGTVCTNGACGSGTCCVNSCARGDTECASSTTFESCALGSNGCWAYGTTSTSCLQNQLCTGPVGKATCSCAAPYAALCGGVCTDTTSNPTNCGQCGTVCGAGCQAGTCVAGCTAPYTSTSAIAVGAFAAACVYEASDPDNCGAIGNACDPSGGGESPLCQAGGCVSACTSGTTACGLSCADLLSDPTNCGACGTVCMGATPLCQAGVCSTPQFPVSVTFATVQACGGGPVTIVVTDTDDLADGGVIDTLMVTSDQIAAADGGQVTLAFPTALPVGANYSVTATPTLSTFTCSFGNGPSVSGVVSGPVTLTATCYQNNC
jgi:hypothetical protein